MTGSRPGRPRKDAPSRSGQLFLEALVRLNRRWVEEGRAHAPFLQRPWNEQEIIDEIARGRGVRKGRESSVEEWARQVFRRGVEAAGRAYFLRLNEQFERNLGQLRAKGIIDARTRRAFTTSQQEANQRLLDNLDRFKEIGASLQQLDQIRRARKRRPGEPYPERLTSLLWGWVIKGRISPEFFNWVVAPISKPPSPGAVFQPDVFSNSDCYVRPSPLTPEEVRSAPRVSHVYSAEFEVRNLRNQLENLADRRALNWRTAQARSVEAVLHKLEEELVLLRNELTETLFTEVGIVDRLVNHEEWRNQRFTMPGSSVATLNVSFPPLRDDDKEQMATKSRAPPPSPATTSSVLRAKARKARYR